MSKYVEGVRRQRTAVQWWPREREIQYVRGTGVGDGRIAELCMASKGHLTEDERKI